jgi:hypothetical protein
MFFLHRATKHDWRSETASDVNATPPACVRFRILGAMTPSEALETWPMLFPVLASAHNADVTRRYIWPPQPLASEPPHWTWVSSYCIVPRMGHCQLAGHNRVANARLVLHISLWTVSEAPAKGYMNDLCLSHFLSVLLPDLPRPPPPPPSLSSVGFAAHPITSHSISPVHNLDFHFQSPC